MNNRIEELTESLSKAVDEINNLKKKLKDPKPISVDSEAIDLISEAMHLFDDVKKFNERCLNYILPTLKSKKLELAKSEYRKLDNNYENIRCFAEAFNRESGNTLNKYEYQISSYKKELEKISNLEIYIEKTLKALHLDSLSLITYPVNILKYDDLNEYEYKIRRLKNRLENMRDLIYTQGGVL